MIERRKSLFHLRTDGGHGNDQRQTKMADDGAPQEAPPVVVAVDIGRHVYGHVGWPRHAAEKHDEAKPHLRHVETEHKRDGNQLRKTEAVRGHRVKLSACI